MALRAVDLYYGPPSRLRTLHGLHRACRSHTWTQIDIPSAGIRCLGLKQRSISPECYRYFKRHNINNPKGVMLGPPNISQGSDASPDNFGPKIRLQDPDAIRAILTKSPNFEGVL